MSGACDLHLFGREMFRRDVIPQLELRKEINVTAP